MDLLAERLDTTRAHDGATSQSSAVSTRIDALFRGRQAWGVALLVAIVSWESGITRPPFATVDDSWRFLLQQAAADRWDFGVDTAFTYGPLVHLDGGPMFSLVGGLSSVGVALALSWSTALFVIRRSILMGMAWWTTLLSAVVLTIIFVPPLRFSESVALVSAAWLISAVVDGRQAVGAQNFVAMIGGIWWLVKPSTALVIGVIAGAAAVAGCFDPDQSIRVRKPELRRITIRLTTLATITIATAICGWLLVGQPFSLIDDYLLSAKELASGYAEAMANRSYSPVAEVLFIVGALALIGLLGWFGFNQRTSRAIFTFLLVAITIAWVRQVALGRPDPSHLKDGGLALGLLGLAHWPVLHRSVARALISIAAVLTGAVLLIGQYDHVGTFASLGPIEAVRSTNELIHINQTVEKSRSDLAEILTPAEDLYARMQDQRVFYSPHLGVSAFALQTDFWIPPAIQNYASFTEHLEDRGAEALLGPDGPQMILHQHNMAIDDRNPAWESPRMIVSMFCSFRHVGSDPLFSLHERVSEDCAVETIAESVPEAGGAIAVPAGIDSCAGIVTFRVVGPVDRVAQLLRRPAPLLVTLGSHEWRIIPGTLSQPHILAAPTTEDWIGDTVANLDSAPTEIKINEAFSDRGPLTTTFECWTPRSVVEES